LKIYLVTNTPSFAQNAAPDVYRNITFQYHQFLASRYQGKIAVWQPFNESNIHNFKNYSTITGFDAAYLASLSSAIRAAASAIKPANPGILIAANAGGYPPSWPQYFSGLISNIDMIGVDLYPLSQYGTGTDADIQKYPATIQSLKSQFGKKIIVSEIGACSGLPYSDQFQAAIIPATIATLQLTPVDAIIVYEMRDDNTTAGDCGNTLGIKRTDGTQKPAYAGVMRALSGTCPQPASVLEPNQVLPPGACILSDNRSRILMMQVDGNLALYRYPTGGPVWASYTFNPSANNYNWGVMQDDGNFCVYANWPAVGPAEWCSMTQGHPGAYLVVQGDGNMVIYAQGGRALWATGTNHP
jgi:hypothetical protein